MSEEMPNHIEQPALQDTFVYDVFVSYSAADALWVQSALLPQLQAAQVRVITPAQFELGAPQASEVERAVLTSRKTLFILTPAYLQDHWAEFGAIMVQTLDPASHERRFIPIIRVACKLPLRLQGLIAFDATAGMVHWEQLIGAIRAPLPEPPPPAIPVLSIPAPAPLPAGSRMPLGHNPLFVGREEELRELARVLKAGDTAAIGQIAAATGLGGIGKTQLAAEFVHRYGLYFKGGVFWLSFADPAAVPAEIVACGGDGRMGLHATFDQLPLEKQVQFVQAAWESPLPRLLVFDNCEDEALLDQWRPKHGGCRVLVTSRRAEWDRALGVHALPLGVLPRTESIALLRSFRLDLAEDDANLDAIAAELGDLPLALHLAGSFLKRYQQDVTAAEYLNELRTTTGIAHESLEGAGISPTQHNLSVARTFHLSYDRLDVRISTDALALCLLARAAYFAPGEPIPLDLLDVTLCTPSGEPHGWWARAYRWLLARRSVALEPNKITRRDALNRLMDLGLLELEADDALRVHRLVAAFVRAVAMDAVAQSAVEQTILDLANKLNKQGYPASLLVLQVHLRMITNMALQRQDMYGAALGNTFGYHLEMIGAYSEAQGYFEQALAICQRVLGPDHPDTATSLNNLGSVLASQGQYAEAQGYYEQALAIRQRVLGPEHPDTATSLNNLGFVLDLQGRYAEAQGYFEQALAIRQRVLGPEHPDTAASLNNLGSVLRVQGQYAEAQGYYEEALAIVERVLGLDHPTTATILNNLGLVLQAQGQYAEAQGYYEQALAIYQRVRGPEHPDTATILNNLGLVFDAQGQYAEAQRSLEQALAIVEQVLGPDHPNTLTIRCNLASLTDQD